MERRASADPAVDVHGEQAGGLAGRAEAAARPHAHQVRGRGRGAGALRARARVRHRRLPRQAGARALQGRKPAALSYHAFTFEPPRENDMLLLFLHRFQGSPLAIDLRQKFQSQDISQTDIDSVLR